MSALPSDIRYYGSAYMPEADGVTVGGSIDITRRVTFTDVIASGHTLDAVSSSASDTATAIVVGVRNTSGTIVTVGPTTLNGTTPVTNLGSSQAVGRILYAALSGATSNGPLLNPGGTAAVGDVALYDSTSVISGHTAQTGSANHSGTTPALFKLQSGDGVNVALGQIIRITANTGAYQLREIVGLPATWGTDTVAINRDWTTVPDNTSTYSVFAGMLFEILPNPVTSILRMFSTSQADVPGGSSRTFYEKFFAVNNDTATALTSAEIEILSESPSLPSGALLDLALCSALADNETTANRQTLPTNEGSGALTFVTQPAFISVPSPGSLPSGAAPNTAGAQGCWARLTLPAGTTVYNGSADVRTQGATV